MDKLLDAINGNQSIVELILSTDGSIITVDPANFQRLVSEHPGLIYLYFYRYQITANDAIKIIRQLHSLEYFRFSMLQSEYNKQLSQHLKDDKKWKVTMSYSQSNAIASVELSRQEQQ